MFAREKIVFIFLFGTLLLTIHLLYEYAFKPWVTGGTYQPSFLADNFILSISLRFLLDIILAAMIVHLSSRHVKSK